MKKTLGIIAFAVTSALIVPSAQAAVGDPVGNCEVVKIQVNRDDSRWGTITKECDLEMSLPGIFVRGEVESRGYNPHGLSIDPNDYK